MPNYDKAVVTEMTLLAFNRNIGEKPQPCRIVVL